MMALVVIDVLMVLVMVVLDIYTIQGDPNSTPDVCCIAMIALKEDSCHVEGELAAMKTAVNRTDVLISNVCEEMKEALGVNLTSAVNGRNPVYTL